MPASNSTYFFFLVPCRKDLEIPENLLFNTIFCIPVVNIGLRFQGADPSPLSLSFLTRLQVSAGEHISSGNSIPNRVPNHTHFLHWPCFESLCMNLKNMIRGKKMSTLAGTHWEHVRLWAKNTGLPEGSGRLLSNINEQGLWLLSKA